MNIGDKIKQLRQSLDLTQDELAQKVGYKSRSSINKIELGERDVSRPMIIKFAEALNTTPAYLMGWEDEQENNEDTASIIKIGKRIESARTDLKLTQEELAKKLGLNKSAEKSNDALIDFLCKTGSFKNYCKIFYHIDSDIPDEQKMLEDLLANGKNEIYDTKSLVGYIELAVQYWEHQKMFM